MSNISLGQYLKDSPKINNVGNNEEPVNEVLLTLIAASVLAYTCQPLLNTDFMKSIGGGIGMMFGGIGSMFGLGRKKDDKDSEKDYRNSKKDDWDDEKDDWDDEKDDEVDGNTSKLDKDSETKKANDMMQNMFAFCQKHIDKEKDENKKKSLTGMLDAYRAASVDDDGNPVPLDKMAERFEQITGQKPEDWAKENGIETPSKEEIEKINKVANDEIGKMSPEERKKVADEGRTKAKSTCAEIKKKREEIEKAKKDPTDAKSKQTDAEKETKTYELTHDGKPDKLIKRKKLRGEGHVWCWASDKKTTVAPDQAREMLKRANIKEGLSLSDWLKIYS